MVETSEKFPPNEKLIQARKLRGWSQEELAQRIGAHAKNVSRWERGSTAVSPYYQQKLCELFNMSAKELGFLPDNSTLTQKKITPDGQGYQEGTSSDDEEQLDEATPNRDGQPEEAIPDVEDLSDEAIPDVEDLSDEAIPDDDQKTDDRERLPSLLDQIQNLVTQPIKKSHQTSSAREKLEDAYQKLLTISLARMTFVHTVEPIRRYSGPVAYERLPQAKKQLDTAEQEFDEDEVSRTLALFDNNRVWLHYVKGTVKFQDYIRRTQNLVEHALKPLSPLTVRVFRIDIMLQGDAAKDEDPVTRKLSKDMENEWNAMVKAMNKRLRL